MFKKIIKATNFSRQEKAVARYMKEVRDIQEARLNPTGIIQNGFDRRRGRLDSHRRGKFFT